MNNLNRVSLTVGPALLALLVLPFAYAQRGPGYGQGTRMYNPANLTTVKGAVEEVKTVTGRHGWNGTHLTLRTHNEVSDVREQVADGKVVSETLKKEAGTVDVHLGPASFLRQKGFSFAKGDQIEVTGAKTEFGGSEAIIAREVKKDGKTLVLRNEQGVSQWSRGWRR